MSYNAKVNNVNVFDRFNLNNYKTFRQTQYTQSLKDSSNEPFLQENKACSYEGKNLKKAVAIASFAGAVIPLVILNRKVLNELPSIFKNGTLFEKVKGVSKLFNIKNDEGEAVQNMMASGMGAILSGFGTGYLLDKDKDNRKFKLKEFVHETSNLVIPTIFVAGFQLLMSKGAKGGGKLASFCENKYANRIIPALLGLGSGVPLAHKTTCEINKKIDNDENTKTKFHFKDFFVHLDDLIGMIVLCDVPYLDTIVDKALPFIYAKCGFESGTAAHKNNQGDDALKKRHD